MQKSVGIRYISPIYLGIENQYKVLICPPPLKHWSKPINQLYIIIIIFKYSIPLHVIQMILSLLLCAGASLYNSKFLNSNWYVLDWFIVKFIENYGLDIICI